MLENVIIIGGGPAGFSAAIYLARAGLKPLVFGGSPPGGQLSLTSEVENFPGYPSILGAELIQKMRDQAKNFGARIVDENVVKVDFSKKPFKVFVSGSTKIFSQDQLSPPPQSAGSVATRLPSQSEVSLRRSLAQTTDFRKNFVLSRSIIIAIGAKALWLNVPGEEKLRGKGVSACATCDGFFFRDKTVAVVGGGDTALEEALTLTKFAKKIYLIHRRDSFRASKIMQERVLANKKIEIIWNAIVEEIIGEKKVEKIRLKLVENNQKLVKTIGVDGVFVAIGHKPDTEIFARQVELDEKGYIITTNRVAQEIFQFSISNLQSNLKSQLSNKKIENFNIENSLKIKNLTLEIQKFDYHYQYQTSVSGVFAAGDCVDNKYRQAAVAAGMGVSAALEVERWLEIRS